MHGATIRIRNHGIYSRRGVEVHTPPGGRVTDVKMAPEPNQEDKNENTRKNDKPNQIRTAHKLITCDALRD